MTAAPLAAGVVLCLLAGIVRMRAWYGAVSDACPSAGIRYRDVVAAHLGGMGFNGIIPAHGGDGIKLGLLKRRFPDTRFGLLLGTLGPPAAVEATFTALLLVWMLASGTVGAPSPGQIPLPLVGAGALLAAAGLWILARRAPGILRDIRRGLVALRRPRLLVADIAPWVLAARVLRLGALACFLASLGLHVTLAGVLVVMAVQMGVGSIGPASTPIRVAVLTSSLPVAIGEHVSAADATALIAGTQLIVMATGLAISIAVLALTLRTRSVKRLVGYCREAMKPAAATSVTKP